MCRKNGFTVTEMIIVLVVIFILYIMLGIHSDGHSSELAKRVQCGSNMRQVGLGIALYSQDYGDKYPVVGSAELAKSEKSFFGTGFYNKDGKLEYSRYVKEDFNWDQQPTVGGSLYLLIKHSGLDPKVFLCPSSEDDEMDFDDVAKEYESVNNKELEDWAQLNDFRSMRNLSFSYNDPWHNPLTSEDSSSFVLMADKNPVFDTADGSIDKELGLRPDINADLEDFEEKGNSKNHDYEIQNVLFNDMHVKRHDNPNVGINEDNIYTRWDGDDRLIGIWGKGIPKGKEDSYSGN
ncbi:MAG: type II secretion system protein [Phycisphaerae bacterium]|nr:type II secretion system protein [Phycisphaerae bacterium]